MPKAIYKPVNFIYSANQLTGFYMMATLALNEVSVNGLSVSVNSFIKYAT